MRRSTLISIILSILLIGGMIYTVSGKPVSSGSGNGYTENIEVRDGVQYVTITAKGGYLPRITNIKSGLPTTLIVETDGTYDCSASLVIRSVGFQKILQPTGEEVIDLGAPKPGEKVTGVCGMGMYSFELKAS